jgi:hypothetical protein
LVSFIIFVLNELTIIMYRLKMLGKRNWVCTICGQDFTRRSSGNRHNSNLHGGMAKLVRPFDYITGRLNGQYPLLHLTHGHIEDTGEKITTIIIGLIIMYCKSTEVSLNRMMCIGITAGTL